MTPIAAKKPAVSARLQAASLRRALLCAALVWPALAHADGPPEKTLVAFKFMNYQDSQPGYSRTHVDTPAFRVSAPVGAQWGLDFTLVSDDVSGTAPRRHTDMTNPAPASMVQEERAASELKLTHYRGQASYALGLGHVLESDYKSNGISFGGNWASEDRNTTWHLGLGFTTDRINPEGGGVLGTVSDQSKKSQQVLVGLTQAMSRVDLVQLNYTRTSQRGYLNDPYKDDDMRPTQRTQNALLGRWNHHLERNNSTLRSSYRYYQDSYAIRAHAVQMEWVKPFNNGFTATPLLRYYTQTKASFYSEAPYDAAATVPAENSYDQRLATFGAITAGLQLAYHWGSGWTIDGRAELYRQRTEWAKVGTPSTGLAPFNARIFQVGVSRSF